MSTETVVRRERAELAALLTEVGPNHPTLDEGWVTADLLEHLLVRERRPQAFVAGKLPLLSSWPERVGATYRRLPWNRQVGLFRNGPPWFTPYRISALDRAFNTGEFFIHHEDVRRGVPGWTVRDLDPHTTQVLTKLALGPLTSFALRTYRDRDLRFRLQLPDGRERVVLTGQLEVTLTGEPGELVLWASGRRACEVRVDGEPEAILALEQATSD
jgi:uncharacterized protein (TIGR03085 family)